MNPSVLLDRLRSNGWKVAVHNDYRLNGVHMTFWLFTKADVNVGAADGLYVIGEGRTDYQALDDIVRKVNLP